MVTKKEVDNLELSTAELFLKGQCKDNACLTQFKTILQLKTILQHNIATCVIKTLLKCDQQ